MTTLESPMPARQARRSRHTGATEAVVAYLESLPKGLPVTLDEIRTATDLTSQQVHSAVYNFINQGRAERVAHKTYRWFGGDLKRRSPSVKQSRPQRALALVPDQTAPAVDQQAVIDGVLDRLFPEGFRARDLPAIREWTACTMELMKKVSRR